MAYLTSAAKATAVAQTRGPHARLALQTALDQITGHQGTAVADLDQTISGTYAQAEVQAISDKVDELLAVLRAAGMIAT